MINMLLDFMLGPFSVIGDFYFEHQVIFNTLVVILALYKVIINKKRRKVKRIDDAQIE